MNFTVFTPMFRIVAPIILVVALLLIIIDVFVIPWLRARNSRAAHRADPPIYAIGSPEHNAQLVEAIHQVNECLAKQGKRVPERAVIDIIEMEKGPRDQHGM